MENATKALLIAGAVLIAIMLISVALIVLNSANGLVGGAQETMNAQEIQAFNANFENYLGDQRGSNIRSLISAITSSNASHDDDHQVSVNYDGQDYLADEQDTTKSISTISSQIRTTSMYHVEMETNAKSGLITKITITKGAGTTEDSST